MMNVFPDGVNKPRRRNIMKTQTKTTTSAFPSYYLGRPRSVYTERFAPKATVRRLFTAGSEVIESRQIAA